MNQSWVMSQQFTSPTAIEPHSARDARYYQAGPPAPQTAPPAHLAPDSYYDLPHMSFSRPQDGLAPRSSPNEVPTHSHLLRTHRSTSSIASHATQDSHTSLQTSLTGWSTTGSPGTGTSDPNSDFEPGEDAFASLSLRRGLRAPSLALSVNPNVFRAKGKDSPSAVSEDVGTAKPRVAGQGQKGAKDKAGKAKGKERKNSHARKQSQQTPEHIPRPPNAFILFRKHVVDAKLIPPTVEMRHQNVSIIVARMWKEAPADQKSHFMQMAKKEKDDHMRKYPGYRYQPVYRRTNVIRRRVRKDDAEEEKCDTVAKLLLAGKTGKELEQEVKAEAEATKAKNRALQQDSNVSELSKGALRAMRARERQSSGASEWSDFSRANSEALGDIDGRDVDDEDLDEEDEDLGDFGEQEARMMGFQPMGLSMDGQQVMLPPGGMPWSSGHNYSGSVDFAYPPPPELMMPLDMAYSQPEGYTPAYTSGPGHSTVNPTFFDPAIPFSPTSGALLTHTATKNSESPFTLAPSFPGMGSRGGGPTSPSAGSYMLPMSARWNQDFGIHMHMGMDLSAQDHVMGGGFENLFGDGPDGDGQAEGHVDEQDDHDTDRW